MYQNKFKINFVFQCKKNILYMNIIGFSLDLQRFHHAFRAFYNDQPHNIMFHFFQDINKCKTSSLCFHVSCHKIITTRHSPISFVTYADEWFQISHLPMKSHRVIHDKKSCINSPSHDVFNNIQILPTHSAGILSFSCYFSTWRFS